MCHAHVKFSKADNVKFEKINCVILNDFIRLRMRELLDDSESTVCGRPWCITHQASRYCAATLPDDQGSGSVMEVMHTIIVRGVTRAVSCDDTADEYGTD
jgi:hypothetical protein